MIIDGLHAHNSLCDCVGQAQITMTAEFVPFANKPKGIIVLEDVYKAKRERRRKQGREVMWPVPRGWTEYTQASGPAWRTNPAMDYDGGVNNGPKHGPKGAAGTMAEFIQLFTCSFLCPCCRTSLQRRNATVQSMGEAGNIRRQEEANVHPVRTLR